MRDVRTVCRVAAVLLCGVSKSALAVCGFDEEALRRDPVEVGFCESDVVFIGKVDQVTESMRGFTAEGLGRTLHFHTQYATIHVLESFKDSPPKKITTVADLNVAESAYVFNSQKTYLVFARRIPDKEEYSAAGACSIQHTLPIDKAKNELAQLRRHKTGRQKIDCNNLRFRKSEPHRSQQDFEKEIKSNPDVRPH